MKCMKIGIGILGLFLGLLACNDGSRSSYFETESNRINISDDDEIFFRNGAYSAENYLQEQDSLDWVWDNCEDSTETDYGNPSGYSDASCMSDASSSQTTDAGVVSSDAGSSQTADAGVVSDAGSSQATDAGHANDASTAPEVEPPEEETRAWFQLSPDDSTSMASAQLLKLDNMPRGFALKAHEVLNYYDPPAALRADDGLSYRELTSEGIFVGLDAESHIVNDTSAGVELDLLVHLYAPSLSVQQRRPWNLHLCVDVSGSMSGDKICQVRNALRGLLEHLVTGPRTAECTAQLLDLFAKHGAVRQLVEFAILAVDDPKKRRRISEGVFEEHRFLGQRILHVLEAGDNAARRPRP